MSTPLRTALFPLLTATALLLGPQEAKAWDPLDFFVSPNCVSNGVRTLGTNHIDVVLHVEECPPADATNDLDNDGRVDTQTCVESLADINAFAVADGIMDVHDMVSAAAGVDLTFSFSVELDSFEPGVEVGAPSPTIHLGFRADHDEPNNWATTSPLGDADACDWAEVQILFNDAPVMSDGGFTWVYDEPADYYEKSILDVSGNAQFRLTYIHELLHGLGLAHSSDEYSHTNYGHTPWARGTGSDMARPLPDDVAGLRYLYPDGTAFGSSEFFFTNTWAHRDETQTDSNGLPVVPSLMNCEPNGGDNRYDRWDGTYLPFVPDTDGYAKCGGTEGVPDLGIWVCPGDLIYTGVTVNNVGTIDHDVEMRAFFSVDDTLSFNDTPSPTVRRKRVDAEDSRNAKRRYEVPDIPDGRYKIIISGNAEFGASDWIPLRDWVYVSSEACGGWAPQPLLPQAGPGVPPQLPTL